MSAHQHHWILPTPNGPTAQATCSVCGDTKAGYLNGWIGDYDPAGLAKVQNKARERKRFYPTANEPRRNYLPYDGGINL